MNKSLMEKLEIIAERHANETMARLISNETHDDTRIVISDINGAINSLCMLVKTIEDLRRSDSGNVRISEELFQNEMAKAILSGFTETKQFYENIMIPGPKVKSVDASPGRVHVTLTAKAGLDAEALRKQYLRTCKLKAPITDVATASVEIENSNA